MIIPEFADHSSFRSRWGGLSAPLVCPNRRHLRSLAHQYRIRKDLFKNHRQRSDELAGIWRHDPGWLSYVALSSSTSGRWRLGCMDTARLLVRRLGVIGVALGTMIPMILLTGVALAVYFRQFLKLPLLVYLRRSCVAPVVIQTPFHRLLYLSFEPSVSRPL